jgi:RNA binding exosome subunit
MFHYVETRVFGLATEDPEKVRKALRFVIGDDEADLSEETTTGFHKNPILIYSYQLKKSKDIKGFFERLSKAGHIKAILTTLEERLDDELMLNIRFNKQESFQERLVLAAEDPKGGVISVRAKVKAFPANREGALKVLKEFLGGLD